MPSASSAGTGSLIRTFSTSTAGYIPATTAIDSMGIYKWITVHVTNVGTGGPRIEFLSANVTSSYQLNPLTRTAGAANTYSMGSSVDTAATSAGLWSGPLIGRYFHLNYSAGTGTVAGTIILSPSGAVAELGSGAGGTGKVTPGTSSTAVLSNTSCRSLSLKAGRTNAGVLYVAIGTAATAAAGMELYAGESVSLDIGFTGNVYVLGTNPTDYLTYMWVN